FKIGDSERVCAHIRWGQEEQYQSYEQCRKERHAARYRSMPPLVGARLTYIRGVIYGIPCSKTNYFFHRDLLAFVNFCFPEFSSSCRIRHLITQARCRPLKIDTGLVSY